MNKHIFIPLFFAFLASCSSVPEIIPGKGAIYGTISAESHKDILAKALKNNSQSYKGIDGIIFNEQMVNYPKLKELYACLISSSFSEGSDHLLVVDNEKISHRSLAIGTGDRLSIQNNSSKTLTFFLAGKDDAIQIYSPIKPGGRSSLIIELEGEIELGSDEDETLMTTLLSRKGLVGQQHSSGDQYIFENLNPGRYKILFWFWRLGFVEKSIFIKAGENISLNQILSVDKILESKNEP
jgi:hypothetical protein